ncbi:MAG TPA: ABC transporter permease [Thermoanaerobaculia bacterium]|nr:ABC transporter permease [Thermoanaerobaculia bacterium]
MLGMLKYRDLLWTLVSRELTVRYKRSTIGFLWTMLQPMLSMIVLHVVFSAIFRFDIQNYPVYALAGILFWNFFSQSIIASMNSLRGNASLLSKLPVPHAVFPLATVVSGLINLSLAMIPLLVILVVTDHPLRPALLFLPVSILIAGLFTLGAGLLLAPMAVFFYDVVEIVGVLMTMMMYLTPVFYPMSIVPEHLRWLVRFNPVRSILEVFRDPIYYGKVPPLSHLAVASGIALVLFAVGCYSFSRSSHRIPLYL